MRFIFLLLLTLPFAVYSQNKPISINQYLLGFQLTSEKPMWIELTGMLKQRKFLNIKVKFSSGNYQSSLTYSYSGGPDNPGVSYDGGSAEYLFSGKHFSFVPGYFINLGENPTGFWLLGLNLPMGIVNDKLKYSIKNDILFGNKSWEFEQRRFGMAAELELLRALRLNRRFFYHFGLSLGYPINFKNPFEGQVPEYTNGGTFIPGIGFTPLFRLQMGIQFSINQN
ncbi:MAG: hypothetical protein FGM41_10040 [Bacteroidetes bacterium]|nr:hypothetical protein [Bacteroidota bacterium]